MLAIWCVRSWPFLMLTALGSQANATPMPEDDGVQIVRVPFSSWDERGGAARPDRFECRAVYVPPIKGLPSVARPCGAWKGHVGIEIDAAGAGAIRVVATPSYDEPLVTYLLVQAFKGDLQTAPIVVTIGNTATLAPVRLLFREKTRPPRVRQKPSAEVLTRGSGNAATVHVKVGFDSSQRDPVSVYWFPVNKFARPQDESTDASLRIGTHYLTALGCNNGGCTSAGVSVLITRADAPKGAASEVPPSPATISWFRVNAHPRGRQDPSPLNYLLWPGPH